MNFQGFGGLLWVAQPVNIKLEKENHVAWIAVGLYLFFIFIIFIFYLIRSQIVSQKLAVSLVTLIGWLKKTWCKSFQRYPKWISPTFCPCYHLGKHLCHCSSCLLITLYHFLHHFSLSLPPPCPLLFPHPHPFLTKQLQCSFENGNQILS